MCSVLAEPERQSDNTAHVEGATLDPALSHPDDPVRNGHDSTRSINAKLRNRNNVLEDRGRT